MVMNGKVKLLNEGSKITDTNIPHPVPERVLAIANVDWRWKRACAAGVATQIILEEGITLGFEMHYGITQPSQTLKLASRSDCLSRPKINLDRETFLLDRKAVRATMATSNFP
jgi:hypothetical protein